MTAAHLASLVLLSAGVAVIAASCLGALALGRVYDRVHAVTAVTSLGAPLVGLALAVADGWGETSAQVLLTVFLLALTGPALGAATGRIAARREGLVARHPAE